MTLMHKKLPPGQKAIQDFPRFGLLQYAKRYRAQFSPLCLQITGEVNTPLTLSHDDLISMRRVEFTRDFHCVTTWSKTGLLWGGYRFNDFYQTIVKTNAQPAPSVKFVIFRCQDGFRTMLLLEDLLHDDVLLADHLNGQLLTSSHGAPLRLVAPAHYGYKNAKHLKAIEFHTNIKTFRPPAPRFMDHPRARVAFEERGSGVPGWLLRYLYRPLIKITVFWFRRSMR